MLQVALHHYVKASVRSVVHDVIRDLLHRYFPDPLLLSQWLLGHHTVNAAVSGLCTYCSLLLNCSPSPSHNTLRYSHIIFEKVITQVSPLQ